MVEHQLLLVCICNPRLQIYQKKKRWNHSSICTKLLKNHILFCCDKVDHIKPTPPPKQTMRDKTDIPLQIWFSCFFDHFLSTSRKLMTSYVVKIRLFTSNSRKPDTILLRCRFYGCRSNYQTIYSFHQVFSKEILYTALIIFPNLLFFSFWLKKMITCSKLFPKFQLIDKSRLSSKTLK